MISPDSQVRRRQPSRSSTKKRNDNDKNKNPLFRDTPKKKTSTTDEAMSINQSLRRTQALLSQELDRTSQVSSVIQQDGKVLGSTKSTQQEMKHDIRHAKGALTGLEREKKKERWIFLAAVVLFYISALYVLWTRIPIPFLTW